MSELKPDASMIAESIAIQDLVRTTPAYEFDAGVYRSLIRYQEELREIKEDPSLIYRLVNAFCHARKIKKGELEAEIKAFKRGNPLYDPEVSDETLYDAGPFQEIEYGVVIKDPAKIALLYEYAILVRNLLSDGDPGIHEEARWRAKELSQHELKHAEFFSEEPTADVHFAAIFYRYYNSRKVTMRPAMNIYGKYKVGTHRRFLREMETSSDLDKVYLA